MLEFNFEPFPEIRTNRLFLRRPNKEDTDRFYELRSDDKVMRYIDIPKLASREAAEELLHRLDNLFQQQLAINWAITLHNRPDELIGTILFKEIDRHNYRAEVGYMLHPAHWRMGILQEALTAILHHGFNYFGFHSMEAFVNPENEASIGLLEKNGFVREAYFRENYYFDGSFLDTAVYSLLKRNFHAKK
jgi:ribosomal-protein-alanine N-acetyltransferase